MVHFFVRIAVLFLLHTLAFGQSPVWQVSKNGQTLYLGGTCHILRKADFPLPAAFDVAYAASDLLVLEIDPAEMEDPAVLGLLMAQSRYTDGRSLKTVLKPQTYAALAEQGRKSGLPIEMLNGFKPGMAIMMISIQELTKIGVTQEGVDLFYAKRARAEQKPVESLETAEFQVGLITAMGEGLEDAFVRYSLEDLEQIEEMFEQLIRSWRAGDTVAMEKLFVEGMRKFPALYNELLKDRNERWMPELKAMLGTPEVELVLVGAAHLVGPDGLLEAFKRSGFDVEAFEVEGNG